MSKEQNDSFGGLKIGNLNDIDLNLFCELCKLLLLHPVQLLCCDTRLCRWCSKKGLPDSQPFICPFCQTKQLKKKAQADRGVEREVNTIKIECYACSWNGSYKNYLEHLEHNHVHLECSDCQMRFFTTNFYEEHRQEICEYRRIPCGLPGCIELVKPSDMSTHYASAEHKRVLFEHIYPYMIWMRSMFFNWECMASISNVDSNIDQKCIRTNESTDCISAGLTTLLDDCTRLQPGHDEMKSKCETTVAKINKMKKIYNTENEKYLAYVQSQNEMDKQLQGTNKLNASTDILLLDENSSLLFPFQKSVEEINSSFSIYSPIFKSSPYGYVFLLRVCSTMKDRKQYLSTYITLLRSEFDPILFYPFRHNITLSLCDQSGQRKDIVSIIKPDSNSPSFARPTSERNNEIGITEFCSLNYLTDPQSIYSKDGAFFIRISFDFINSGR